MASARWIFRPKSNSFTKAFWIDKLTTGELNLESLATTAIESVEMQTLYYAAAPQWDFSL
jgi:hypothetical protein